MVLWEAGALQRAEKLGNWGILVIGKLRFVIGNLQFVI